jgi:hypothetical protein
MRNATYAGLAVAGRFRAEQDWDKSNYFQLFVFLWSSTGMKSGFET